MPRLLAEPRNPAPLRVLMSKGAVPSALGLFSCLHVLRDPMTQVVNQMSPSLKFTQDTSTKC